MNWFIDHNIDNIENHFGTRLLRGLKGGSGGGGGGGSGGGGRGGGYSSSGSSYSSRGGYYYGSNSYNNNGSSEMPTWLIIVLVVGLSLCGVCYCVYKSKEGNGNGSSIKTNNVQFNELVSKARQRLEQQTNSGVAAYTVTSNSTNNLETYQGDFDVQHLDRGNLENGSATIRMQRDNTGNGYKIEGECSDNDGRAQITQGFASFSGEAWWVEEVSPGQTDAGLKVLSEGKFNFDSNTFAGTWRANTGVTGTYTSFKGRNVSKTFSPSSGGGGGAQQTLQEMLEEDIPLAVATVETPEQIPTVVVNAVPEQECALNNMPVVSAFPQASAPPPEPTAPTLYVPR